MNDTPRTDAAYYVVRNSDGTDHNMVKAEFARELERELHQAKASADKWCARWRDDGDSLRAELAELRADKARLDWLTDKFILSSRARHPEDGQTWPGGRGTHVELGIAIAAGKPVVFVSPIEAHHESTTETCAFYHHPCVWRCRYDYEVPALVEEICAGGFAGR